MFCRPSLFVSLLFDIFSLKRAKEKVQYLKKKRVVSLWGRQTKKKGFS